MSLERLLLIFQCVSGQVLRIEGEIVLNTHFKLYNSKAILKH